MSKKKKVRPPKKKLSEGQAIAITVLLFAVGLIAFIYAIKYVIDFFFPNL
ncbi:MAG: hypothetical protein PVH63_07970 [Balneolaceae bacterium]|jgi:hypothetical protein